MRKTVNLIVKGTKYYKAAELFQRGSLSPGLAIRLEHQPHNPHDKNAVAVLVRRSGAMLGHVSMELAPKYATIINSGRIIEASIANVENNGPYINIDIRVAYEQSDEQLAEQHNSRLWLSASVMPAEAGVYAIRNINSGRQYIGSSNNLKDRIRSHMRDLSLGCHANHALQSDFSLLGPDHFEANVVVNGISSSNLTSVEADIITSLLNSGTALYNLTANGQGKIPNSRGYIDSKPVSDRLVRQGAEVELRQRQADETAKTAEPAVKCAQYAQDAETVRPRAQTKASQEIKQSPANNMSSSQLQATSTDDTPDLGLLMLFLLIAAIVGLFIYFALPSLFSNLGPSGSSVHVIGALILVGAAYLIFRKL